MFLKVICCKERYKRHLAVFHKILVNLQPYPKQRAVSTWPWLILLAWYIPACLDKCSRFFNLVIQRGLHVNALNYIGSSSKLMAVYQALTLRLNPLKMDQIRKKNYIRSKDNQPKYEGGVDKEKRPLSLFLFLMARNTNISTLMHDRILFSNRYIYQIITSMKVWIQFNI